MTILWNSKLSEESTTLDTGLDGYLAGGLDISNMKGIKYQEIFLGQKTWLQVFDTPDPVEASESSSNEEAETTDTDEASEVTFF
ncbi:hypothetical protein [Enterococcus faecalis]|uniref:hypothetical protein n=1 Tax=Enterococcus faecalis TaxID=1351 RepID=UPI00192738A1|nr:hypothetical protein [Enterococcus faecalis]